MMSNGGGIGIIFGLIFAIIGIAAFVFWIVALVDAIKVPNDADYRAGNKVIWVLVVALTGAIGAIIYWVVGRPARSA